MKEKEERARVTGILKWTPRRKASQCRREGLGEEKCAYLLSAVRNNKHKGTGRWMRLCRQALDKRLGNERYSKEGAVQYWSVLLSP